jgi:DNA-binding transcriptional ArsR family regulator
MWLFLFPLGVFMGNDVFSEASGLSLPQAGLGERPHVGQSPEPFDSALGWIEGKFLNAKIPLCWLSRACRLPGKALETALAIWFLKGLSHSVEDLKLTSAVVERFDVSPPAKSRALTSLQKAGLIRVVRRRGKNPLVTILKVEEDKKTPSQEAKKL